MAVTWSTPSSACRRGGQGSKGRYKAAGEGIRHRGEVHGSRGRDTSAGGHCNEDGEGYWYSSSIGITTAFLLQPPSVCLIYKEPANLVEEERREERHEMKSHEDRPGIA